ncbi:MAG: Wadjet anti-phage system protein JetD domain-containing protein [Pseudomonadota bacterium]
MKTPAAIRARLCKQWLNPSIREQLLQAKTNWPLEYAIGKPLAKLVEAEPYRLREHLDQWRRISIGTVEFRQVKFQKLSDPVELPVKWLLRSPEEWVAACDSDEVRDEFCHLRTILNETPESFQSIIVRQRQQVLARSADEVLQIIGAAEQLSPGCAQRQPLRSLSVAGSDSKFFERNRGLLMLLLEQRFGAELVEHGLERFLDALEENDHWLLVAPLQPGLLPFDQQRIRAHELMRSPLPDGQIFLVENERSLYQLPKINGSIAVLGSGLNLSWLSAPWLRDRDVIYWGDIDSWGLLMLASARAHLPQLNPILMDRRTFDEFADSFAVEEPRKSGEFAPENLTSSERDLFDYLINRPRGRLEQEFIPREKVADVLR